VTDGKSDGRRARGAARRRQLVDAALAVLERDGIAGLTHRAVAEHAGVPLASASYHFAGIDDLIVTALLLATDDLAAALRADSADRSLARLARMLADELHTHRDLLIAEYELYLLAARRPHLRPAALAWLDVIADAFAPDLSRIERQAFQATIEGICLHALLTHAEADAANIEATLQAAWPSRPPA
jgi:TetR/AcrR family transcriptional regulator, regulator of biofilm formation and stress response